MFLRRLACLAALSWACASAAQPVSFGLFGDTPYNRFEREQLPAMLATMGRDNLAFAVHAGDIKSGSSVCSDEALLDILGVFRAAPLPLVYVLGDNEWTDCHRANNGSYDPLERLARLRELFLVGDDTLGARPLRLERQSADPAYAIFRENVRWAQASVLFVGLNLPGSENNFHGTRAGSGPVPEFVERSRANAAWLAQSFALARSRQLAGVLIVVQGNPDFEAARAGQPKPGYRDFIAQLRRETEGFAGQVVLVHGDTHKHQINQPLFDETGQKLLSNFTRVEIHGSPFTGWVRGTVDARDPRVFTFESKPWRAEPVASSP